MSKRVLILAGGQSAEHSVSLISARSVLNELTNSNLQIEICILCQDGTYLSDAESRLFLGTGAQRCRSGDLSSFDAFRIFANYDVIFPLLHGPKGEDGTIQGVLEVLGLPYIGSGVLGSALCMDKVLSKDVLALHGFRQLPYRLVQRNLWRRARQEILANLRSELEAPYFVKPANLGSSIGISKAKDHHELSKAIDLAADYDRRIIVEHGLTDPRELEVGLLGNDQAEVSPVGEIRYDAEFYDYHAKYTDNDSQLVIPAEIPDSAAETIRVEATRAFKALDCVGLARIDYLYDEENGMCYLNEINTMPGFTPVSMFPKLWQHTGMSYAALVERLVVLALEHHETREAE